MRTSEQWERWPLRAALGERAPGALLMRALAAMLLLAGIFNILTWHAQQKSSEHVDAVERGHAARAAYRIGDVFEREALQLQRIARERAPQFAPGVNPAAGDAALQLEANENIEQPASFAVFRQDGSVAGLREHRRGVVAASGADDVMQTVARQALTRRSWQLSNVVQLDDGTPAIAIAQPFFAGGEQRALVRLAPLPSTLAVIISPSHTTGKGALMTLVDGTGATVVAARGAHHDESSPSRAVAHTSWRVLQPSPSRFTGAAPWVYLAVAVLLLTLTGLWLLQAFSQRHLRRQAQERRERARLLHELATRLLTERVLDAQLAAAAQTARGVADLTGARVRIETPDADHVVEDGVVTAGEAALVVPIEAHDEEVELSGCLEAFSRDGRELDAEEEQLVRAVAGLLSASSRTHVALSTERRARTELQRLDELRANLLATVAHELLSPLTAVRGTLDLLTLQPDLGERTTQYVQLAIERTDRLSTLIRDLFDTSLLDTGQLDISPTRVDARELLQGVLGAQAATRSGELKLTAPDDLDVTVDAVRFDQIVNNLVTNAFRHGRPPVEVALEAAPGGVNLVVTDEGAGVPPSQRAAIFDKFWQGSSGHAREQDGAGLGLSLVRGLMLVHGGTIAVDSHHANGRGARFTAFFPDVPPGMRGAGGAAVDSAGAWSR